jgi:hypothetical protein
MTKEAKEMQKAYEKAVKKRRQDEENAKWLAKQQDALHVFLNEKIKHDGQEVTRWEAVTMEVKKATHPEQNAYHDWRAAMMALLAAFSTLVDAGNHSLEGMWKPYTNKVKQFFHDNIVVGVKDLLRGPYDLSPLIHKVSMDTNGKIDYGLTRADKQPEMGDMNAKFKVLVALWLSEHGYTPKPPPEEDTYINANKAKLTATEFNRLKSSVNGLDEFLNRETSLKFQEAVEPQPASSSPSP